MSASASKTIDPETTPETPETPETTPADMEAEITVIADGSVVSDEGKLGEIKTSIMQALKLGISRFRSMTKTYKAVAMGRADVREYIILANGRPDWSAASDAYRLHIDQAEGQIWSDAQVTKSEKRKIDGAIRQHVNRTFLDLTIARYVRKTVAGMAEVPDSDEGFRAAMADQYKSAGLTVPTKHGGTSGDGSEAGGGGDNPAADLEKTVSAIDLTKIAPAAVLTAALRVVSEVSVLLTADPSAAVQDKPQVFELLEALETVSHLTGKTLHGKATAADVKTLTAALWNPAK